MKQPGIIKLFYKKHNDKGLYMNIKPTKIMLFCAGIFFFSFSHQAMGAVLSANCPDPKSVIIDPNNGNTTAPLLLQGCIDAKKLISPPPGLVTPLIMTAPGPVTGPIVGFYSAQLEPSTNRLTCSYILVPGAPNRPPETVSVSHRLPGDPPSQQFVPSSPGWTNNTCTENDHTKCVVSVSSNYCSQGCGQICNSDCPSDEVECCTDVCQACCEVNEDQANWFCKYKQSINLCWFGEKKHTSPKKE